MERRGFLGAILAAGMAPAFVGAKVLMPVKSIWRPQIDIALVTARTNNLVTYDSLAEEMLQFFNQNLDFAAQINKDWENLQWTPQERAKIMVRKPKPLVLNRIMV